MSHGKNVCKVLKDIRRKVAADNGIPLEIPECTFGGDCKGTCPRCEAEVRYIERELLKRRALGKAVTVAGLALSSVMLPGCHQPLQGEPLPPEASPTETISTAANLEIIDNQTDTAQAPPNPAEYQAQEVLLGIVLGGIEDEDSPKVDSALLNVEIPLIEEISDDSDLGLQMEVSTPNLEH